MSSGLPRSARTSFSGIPFLTFAIAAANSARVRGAVDAFSCRSGTPASTANLATDPSLTEAEPMWRCFVLLALAPNLQAADKEDPIRAEAAAALKQFYEHRLNQPFLRNPDDPEPKPFPPPWEVPLK